VYVPYLYRFCVRWRALRIYDDVGRWHEICVIFIESRQQDGRFAGIRSEMDGYQDGFELAW